jgi:hypothetical protein
MREYLAYIVSEENCISAPAELITCDGDEEAIQRALPLVNGHDVELWDGPRFVTRLKSGATSRPRAEQPCDMSIRQRT